MVFCLQDDYLANITEDMRLQVAAALSEQRCDAGATDPKLEKEGADAPCGWDERSGTDGWGAEGGPPVVSDKSWM